MSTTNGERRDHAAQVVPTVFGELLEDRRVLFIGAADEDVCDRLLERCRALRVLDTSTSRSRRRPKGYRLSGFRPGALGFGEGSFDAAVVPDVSVFGAEAEARLGELARVVGPGLLVVGVGSGGASHETLFTAVDRHFEHTRLFGEVPFVGVAVADVEASGDVEVVVDATLAPTADAPRAFVVVGSGTRLRVPEYTVLSLGALPAPAPAAVPQHQPDESLALREELDAAHEHGEALEATVGRLEAAMRARTSELEAARRAERDARAEANAARDAASRAPTGPSETERQLTRELAELEATLVERGRVVRELEAEVERRGTLVRDAVEEARRLRRVGAGEPSAVERALASEAARAAAQFEADELRTKLRSHETSARGRTEAEAADRVALEERHQLTVARLVAAESSIESRRERERELSRALDAAKAEAAEAASAVRPDETFLEGRVRELTESERRLSQRVGELSNQLVAARDLAAVPAPRASAERERLEGQIVGLRMRLASAERSLAARAPVGPADTTAAATGAALASSEELESLRARVDALVADNERLAAQTAAEAERLRVAKGELEASHALAARMQLELATQEADVRALEAQSARLRERVADMNDRTADAIEATEAREAAEQALAEAEQRVEAARQQVTQLEAEKAALSEQVIATVTELAERDAAAPTTDPRVEPLEAEAAALRAELVAASRDRDGARALLAETRAALEGLRSDQDAAPRTGEPSTLERELRDRDTMIRSLTAQLEERNDRMRALERRLSGSIPPGPPDEEAASRQMLELSERAQRLSDEVAAEREARAAAMARLAELEQRPSAEAELGHLRAELGQTHVDLETIRGRADGLERDVRSLREVCGEARQGLESLLGDATSAGDQEAADRLGRLLTILGTF